MSYVYSCRCANGDKEFKLAFNYVLAYLKNFVIIEKSMEELKLPFHCIITGPTNCGKTKYLIEQFRGPFYNVFDTLS